MARLVSSSTIHKISSNSLQPFTINEIIKYTSNPPNFDWLCHSANWLQKQFSTSLAQSLYHFERLSYSITAQTHFQSIFKLYEESFHQIYRFPSVRTEKQLSEFTQIIKAQFQKHSSVIETVSNGTAEVNVSHPDIDINPFLKRLLCTRIGIRLLTEHHVWAYDGLLKNIALPSIIVRNLSPAKILRHVAAQVIQSTEEHFGEAPEIHVLDEQDVTFPYIPDHLYYIAQELLKNAVAATQGNHGARISSRLPKIVVKILKGDGKVFIIVSDRGGGLDPSVNEKVWKFGYTKKAEKERDLQYGLNIHSLAFGPQGSMALGGHGFGLPLAGLFTEFFGGSLRLVSMHG